MENSAHLLTVGDFVLNTSSRKLFDSEKEEVPLAPTLFTLLKFFIDHQNQLVSKEMIINHVWKGKVVVDANVNQNVKKLRDVLGDSASAPKYIETVTGEGFRFIANSEEYRAVPTESQYMKTRLIYGVVTLLVIMASLSVYFSNNKNHHVEIKELHPLTTLRGLEHYPDISADKRFLVFTHKHEGSWDIYIKPLNTESYHPIVVSENDETFPIISHDGSKLIYFSSGKNSCGLFIRDIIFEPISVGEAQVIKKCQDPTERIKAEWIAEEEIFISINEDIGSPASIYHYDLSSKKQVLISKPDTKGFGDYAMKYSRELNKLAYIRNIGWSSSEIWVYDLVDRSHNKIKSTPLLLRDLDWDEDGWLYIQSGNKEISRISEFGTDEEVMAKFLSNIYLPFVVNKHSIGVVIGNYKVIDIGTFDIKSNKYKTLISSSFNDYFGSGGSDFVVFISTRSGDPQIWIKDSQGIDRQLTFFNKSYDIKRLSVSAKSDLIMYNKSGHINIIDHIGDTIFNSENYSQQVHNNPVFDIDNDRFMYSIQYNGEWTIETRKLSSPGTKNILFEGTSARPCIESDCLYYVKEKDPYLYKYTPQNNTSERIVEIGEVTNADEWDIYDDDNILFLEKGESINRIIKLNLINNSRTSILESKAKMFSFDRAKFLIYTNLESQGSIDMMYFEL